MSDRSIQNIFKSYETHLALSRQPLKNRKAIHAITHCRTKEMGSSYYSCPDRHEAMEVCHSCRNRSCYVCAQKTKLEWIEKQKSRLYDVCHFHVVFTLPHEYLSLWRYNEQLFSRLLFQASKETLLELVGDTKRHGVVPGILMALHTWGRKLDLHPHTHCLITAGGVNSDGEWVSIGEYLLPVRVVKSFYRGKMQAFIDSAYREGDLVLPEGMSDQEYRRLYREAYKKEWSVRIEDRYEHGKGVILYLSRYLKGGPLHPKQLKLVTSESIEFSYLDHRDKRVKRLRLTPEVFLSRVLTHVPSIGQHTVRYYGVYAASSKAKCRESMPRLVGSSSSVGLPFKSLLFYCKVCGGVANKTHSIWGGERKKENSFINGVLPTIFAQQIDEADKFNVAVARGP